jgi:CubicO group peptidase (beta-lactamase class C family)
MRALSYLFVALLALLGVGAIAQQGLPKMPLGPNPVPAPAAATPMRPDPGVAQLTPTDVNAWLDGYLPYALGAGDIAGAVVVVVKDGQVLTQRGYGFADVASRKPVDPAATLFRPGSVSKLFAWTAVMQQVEAGKLDLDADVNRYIDFRIPARDGKPVTLRNLMTHTAGFEEQVKSIIGFDRAKVPAYDVLLKRWVPERVYAAGTMPAYSNYGASLAGYIVERVSGEPFDAYVERHIFGPLGMTNSSTRQPLPPRLQAMMATGYQRASGDTVKFEYVGPAPAGSSSSTGADMAKFMIAHLNQGQGLMRPETARLMHETPLTILPGVNRMLLGFYEMNINGHRALGHGGDTVAFHSDLMIMPDDHVGVFISMNSRGKDGASNMVRAQLMEQFADRYFPATAAKRKPVPDNVAADHARMMTGTWISSRGSHSSFISLVGLLGQTKVAVDGKGRLVAPIWPSVSGAPRRWVEIAPFVWEDVNGHEKLAAEVKDGKVTRFTEDAFSPFMIFYRAPWYQSSALLTPLLGLCFVILLLTVLLWPVRALVRRHFGTKLALEGTQKRAHLLSRLAARLILLVLAGWFGTVITMLSNLDNLSSGTDIFIRILQLLSWIAFIGGLVVLAWNVWVTWRGGRRWPAKVWSIALLVAAVIALWVALAFNLLSFGINY